MFIKTTRSGKYEYLQIVKSERINGITRHKVLMNLGRKEEIKKNPLFKRLAKKLAEITSLNETRGNIKDLSPATIKNWGYVVYKRIWKSFKLDNFLEDLRKNDSKAEFNLSNTAFLMVLQHLLEPMSKLKTFNHKEKFAKLPNLKLPHLYRSLDILSRNKDKIEDHIFYQNYDLWNREIDIVFYDVTTFAFESVRNDGLRDFGYSKDNKHNEVQVVMGLLIDSRGFPIGYELFRGSTFDGKTITSALNNLKKRFAIKRVIIVADRGLNSKINLKMIKDAGYGYIVASRIKKLNEKVKEKIFDPEGYTELTSTNITTDSNIDSNGLNKEDNESKNKGDNNRRSKEDKEIFRYKVIDYTNSIRDGDRKVHKLNENLIVTYSSARAKRDKIDRERLIEKARKLVEEPGRVKAYMKRGRLKYLKKVSDYEEENLSFTINEEIIKRDEEFDGYYGIQTSEKNMKVKDILNAYHTLWKIEESFRLMKSTLEVRPVFHWTESRIKGHFLICFLSFLLERELECILLREEVSCSPEKIREALNEMEFAEVELNGEKYYIKTKGNELSNKILKAMHIKPPNNVLYTNEFDE